MLFSPLLPQSQKSTEHVTDNLFQRLPTGVGSIVRGCYSLDVSGVFLFRRLGIGLIVWFSHLIRVLPPKAYCEPTRNVT